MIKGIRQSKRPGTDRVKDYSYNLNPASGNVSWSKYFLKE